MNFVIKKGVLKKIEGSERETSIIIPNGVTSLEKWSLFNNYDNLTSITIPDSIIDVGFLRYITKKENWDDISVSNENVKFSSIDGVLYNKSLTELIRCPTGKVSCNIPDGVTSIAADAFCFCENLRSVTIPNSVTKIWTNAFSNCKELTSITIPCDVTRIEPLTFAHCIELVSVIIPDRVMSIEQYAFMGCFNLTSIRIGDNVEYIEDAFTCCNRLSSILVSNKNIFFKILDGVLYRNNLTELVMCLPNKGECFIPDSVTAIGKSAFDGCKKLTSIIIPESVECIGESAFESCSNLKSIILPNSLESIESYTFTSCTNLTSIIIPNSVTSIGQYAFNDCTNLISIIIPESVTNFGDNIFDGCQKHTIYASANSHAENYAKDNDINFMAKSDNMPTVAKHGHETKPANSVVKNRPKGLDFITSSEDQLYNDFYDSSDDSDEPLGGCIFLISVKSEDIASIIVERYANQCGESGLSKYDVVTSDDGIPVHLFRELGICMFEISNEGEYGGPLPESQETLTDIVKYWVKNFFRNDESRNFEGYELDQYIESAEYLEMMNNLKYKGTYYQGRFKYSEDIADCIDPSHMRGFAFAESYIADYISD